MVRHETNQAYVVGPLVKMRFSGWTLAALAIAGLLVVPIVSVFSSFMTPAGEVWRHLWRTQLVELMTNTVSLLAGVGGGTLVVSTGAYASCHSKKLDTHSSPKVGLVVVEQDAVVQPS